jgi:two-component system response regulator FixJ
VGATVAIHIVDDDAAVRDSLGVLLAASGFAVQTHTSAAAFLAAAADLAGCVLTDVRMPGIDGLELQQRLNERGVRLPVIVMTGQGDIPVAVRAMKAGAVDFLEKPLDDDRLLEAVQRALEEGRRLDEARAASAEAAGRLAGLTPREREVLDLLVTGLSNKAVGNELGASPRTIEVHRARILDKLHARSLPDLVRLLLAAQEWPR